GGMTLAQFPGVLPIYYVLIALGGGVLTGFTFMLVAAIGMNADWFVAGWLIPCGAAGAVIVGSWLVEAKQSVIENMAPVLTRLFTPLFTVLLLVFLATMAWTGSPINVKREVLIDFDLLLAVVPVVMVRAVFGDPLCTSDEHRKRFVPVRVLLQVVRPSGNRRPLAFGRGRGWGRTEFDRHVTDDRDRPAGLRIGRIPVPALE